jgi:hypothetical protein
MSQAERSQSRLEAGKGNQSGSVTANLTLITISTPSIPSLRRKDDANSSSPRLNGEVYFLTWCGLVGVR